MVDVLPKRSNMQRVCLCDYLCMRTSKACFQLNLRQTCWTKNLSFGERPVNCPVDTQKVPLAVASPSLFFVSCSKTWGYGRLWYTVDCAQVG